MSDVLRVVARDSYAKGYAEALQDVVAWLRKEAVNHTSIRAYAAAAIISDITDAIEAGEVK